MERPVDCQVEPLLNVERELEANRDLAAESIGALLLKFYGRLPEALLKTFIRRPIL